MRKRENHTVIWGMGVIFTHLYKGTENIKSSEESQKHPNNSISPVTPLPIWSQKKCPFESR